MAQSGVLTHGHLSVQYCVTHGHVCITVYVMDETSPSVRRCACTALGGLALKSGSEELCWGGQRLCDCLLGLELRLVHVYLCLCLSVCLRIAVHVCVCAMWSCLFRCLSI